MRVLLLRLTSLGNVAMTVPVVASLSERYPEHEFIVVAKKPLSAMFFGLPNVRYHEVKSQLGTPGGLLSLYRELCAYKADVVVDWQNVLVTRVLRYLLRMRGVKTYCYRAHAGVTEFERYQQVLTEAGLRTDSQFTSLAVNEDARAAVLERFGAVQGQWIGIAPFAKSKSNMLPYHTTKELIQRYSSQPDTRVYLFGAGRIESEMLRQWASIFPNVVSVAGLLPLEQELELMRMLRVMICMDSANQHLSSLVGLRAVSIWCATHPKLGFYGWKQNPNDRLETEHLKCRPCTVHGTNTCKLGNFACRNISAETIVNKVQENKRNNE